MFTEKIFIQAINDNLGIIHKVCNLYLKELDEKDDLFQEILLNAWKGCKNFKGDAKFSTWLYRVALNTAITFYRKGSKKLDTSSLQGQLAENVADEIQHNEQTQAMYEAIADLSKIDKAIVLLYLEEYSYLEIGDITGISANNVAVKMNRIKIKLRESSKKYLSL
jgi:RNA polymerase sigma-70 factor, ECF subfamily